MSDKIYYVNLHHATGVITRCGAVVTEALPPDLCCPKVDRARPDSVLVMSEIVEDGFQCADDLLAVRLGLGAK